MDDGVHFADIGEELIAEPFALRGAAHQTGDIDEEMRVGMISFDLAIPASFCSRSSGTATSPVFGSMVQKG
jgi:hypothetical protein